MAMEFRIGPKGEAGQQAKNGCQDGWKRVERVERGKKRKEKKRIEDEDGG